MQGSDAAGDARAGKTGRQAGRQAGSLLRSRRTVCVAAAKVVTQLCGEGGSAWERLGMPGLE